MPRISLGFSFRDGDRVSPESLHRLIDEATVSGFNAADLGISVGSVPSYGSTRPTLARGRIHYDTTAGLEGLYYAFLSASAASVSRWLCATPYRSCVCWAASAVSAYTPVFIGRPGVDGNAEFVAFDGMMFPAVWQFSGASGPDAAHFITLESAGNNSPVLCAWAGVVPGVNLTDTASGASTGSALLVDYAAPGAYKAGARPARSLQFGVFSQSSTVGAVLWGTGCAIEDIS